MYYTVWFSLTNFSPLSLALPHSLTLKGNLPNNAKTIWRLLMRAVLGTAVHSLGSRRGHGACALRSLLVVRVVDSLLS